MKGIAFILSLLLFSTSLKASAFVSGVSYALQGEMSLSSCCKTSEPSESTCDIPSEKDEKEGCCEGDNCDCTCCVHITFITHLTKTAGFSDYFADVKFNYSFLYQADYLNSVFHPPSVA